MNIFTKTNLSVLLLLMLAFGAAAQKPAEVIVPLSKPNEAGSLEVNLILGTIRITGTNGKEVVVIANGNHLRVKSDHKTKEEEEGLRKITDNSPDLTISEKNNRVYISHGSIPKAVHLEILVPQKFNLKISSVNNGNLVVANVEGNLEINNVNGNITLENVSGNAIASTTNGNVKAIFRQWDGKSPMAFSTLNGNVDVSVPARAKFDVKLSSSRGDVYTDFDIAKQDKPADQAQRSPEGEYKIRLDGSVTGRVNGGGPEIMMRNMNGNIYLRTAKK